MTLFQSILLGIVQGLTEFLPVSSSAHLVLVPYLFGWQIPADQAFVFDVLVQVGTVLAVIVYFWKDLWSILKAVIQGLIQRKPFEDPNARLGWLLVLATIPAGLFGITIKKLVEAAFDSPVATACFLMATAIILVLAEIFSKRQRKFESITWKDALCIGAAQAVSIFPGISRSGSTIAGGLACGLERTAAARFSFLMSVPIMLAASLVGIKDLTEVSNLSSFLPVLLVGFVTAAVVGYLSIHWLLRFLNRHGLIPFAIYVTLLSWAVLIFTWLGTAA